MLCFFFRIPDESYFDAADLLGEVFVETDQTVGHRNGVILLTVLIVPFLRAPLQFAITYYN